jgi:tRNA pseudouridine-54 N-methylase
LVNILILTDKISNFTKNDIDLGRTPLDVYKLCSIIRESFCCSYSIRKFNNLYIYFDSTQFLIKFEGISLRYLGSDERSQALLVKRALEKLNGAEKVGSMRMQKSTPGIFIKKSVSSESILDNIANLDRNKIILINEYNVGNIDSANINLEEIDNLWDYCYIFPYAQNSERTIELLRAIEKKHKLKYVNLLEIKGIENKILYVNFLIDQKENQILN